MEYPLKTVHPVFHSNIYDSVIIDLKNIEYIAHTERQAIHYIKLCVILQQKPLWHGIGQQVNIL